MLHIYIYIYLVNIGQVRELVALRAKVLELDTEADALCRSDLGNASMDQPLAWDAEPRCTKICWICWIPRMGW